MGVCWLLCCKMSKKLTYEYVNASFAGEGYTLLSKEYINNSIKLDYLCPKGHKHSISWRKWVTGRRCYYCNGSIKPTTDEIKSRFDLEGYTLLSTEYLNNATKLEYVCNNGHRHSISWGKWQAGKRCPYCAGLNKLIIDDVRQVFESEGYTLLSKEYINNKTKLKYICPKGHHHSIRWDGWQRGCRCQTCSGKLKLTYEFVKNTFEKEGYILLSKEYIDASSKLQYICPEGHTRSIVWGDWQQGHRCAICSNIDKSIRFSGPNSPNWRGGLSSASYCEAWKDLEYKKDICDRDGNRCLNPYCESKNNNDLAIHHIDYNKQNCHPKNLITVCRSCNSKANKDREWHKSWYQAIIRRRRY